MNVNELAVAAGKDTSFELYLASGEDFTGNLLDQPDTDIDPKKL